MLKRISLFVGLLFVEILISGEMTVSAQQYQQIIIGQNDVMTLNDAMNAIFQNPGDVYIYLPDEVVQYGPVSIPKDKGIKSVTITSITQGQSVNVDMNQNLFCANGIPLTIDRDVSLKKSFLIGGNCLSSPGNIISPGGNITIVGKADSVFAGGFASGSGAFVETRDDSIITVFGMADYVYGAGYSLDGGITRASGTTKITLVQGSVVNGIVYSGGLARGNGSESYSNNSKIDTQNSAVKISYSARDQDGGAALITHNSSAVPQITQASQNPRSSFEIFAGPGTGAPDLYSAVMQVPYNAGSVTISIVDNFIQSNDVIVPTDRGITSILIQSVTGNSTVTWGKDIGFYACGIPFKLAENMSFEGQGVIYGGCNTLTGNQSYLISTYLDIAGTAYTVVAGSKARGDASNASVENTYVNISGTLNGWAYNGGSALYGGTSKIIGTAQMILPFGSQIKQSIANGGFSFGSGSQSIVTNSFVDISGTIVYAVFGGGYADHKGNAAVTGYSQIILEPTGSVGQSVWYGGRAYNNASAYTAVSTAQINGHIGVMIHREGRGTTGGTSSIGVIQ